MLDAVSKSKLEEDTSGITVMWQSPRNTILGDKGPEWFVRKSYVTLYACGMIHFRQRVTIERGKNDLQDVIWTLHSFLTKSWPWTFRKGCFQFLQCSCPSSNPWNPCNLKNACIRGCTCRNYMIRGSIMNSKCLIWLGALFMVCPQPREGVGSPLRVCLDGGIWVVLDFISSPESLCPKVSIVGHGLGCCPIGGARWQSIIRQGLSHSPTCLLGIKSPDMWAEE